MNSAFVEPGMVVGAMQPYFFPYIGYFQLMAACHLFIIRDDTQFIASGWVNRNRILVGGVPSWITLPVARAPHHLPILSRRYLLNHRLAKRIRRRIVSAYERAPYFPEAMAAIDEALSCDDANVANFNTRLLVLVARRLGIHTPVRMASTIESTDAAWRSEQRVIDICVHVGASAYVNPSGGARLYNRAPFAAARVSLQFLQSCAPTYPQFGTTAVPNLSVIDVMMFNDPSRIAPMIQSYRLLSAPGDTCAARTNQRGDDR